MKKISIILLSCALLTPVLVNAAPSKKPINNWTCEDFLALNSTYQPTVVGVITTQANKGKPEGQVLDVEGIEKVTPIIIQECKKDKKQNFKQKLTTEWTKIKKDL
ncbi:acid-activated periplasmic chaperone HdeA [Acinetobacter sp. WU_MDCI_Axc73]|nr:acid-activated periplasmic chaperone HdeA [Acinetobacter sp. WU_MDCI_Axc73]